MLKRLSAALLRRETKWRSAAHKRWFGFCAVCLSLYSAYVSFLAGSGFLASPEDTIKALLCFVLLAAGIYCLLLFACKALDDKAPKPVASRRLSQACFFTLSAALSLAILLCAYAAAYPGGVTYDASNQWRQMQSGEYNNWHPVFHTLLVWLGARFGGYSLVLLLQIIAFSLAMGYFSCSVRKLGAPSWLILLLQALAVGSPLVRNTLMTVGKDGAMCIGAVCLFAQCVSMLNTRGEWLRRPINAICFGLLAGFVSLVRHNGALLALPMLVIALCCFPARRMAAAALGTALGLMLLVRVPLYGALDVVYPNNTLEEAIGLPMTVMANIKQSAPDKLDGRTNEFLGTLASDEDWQNVYIKDNYNSIKFTYPRELIAKRGAGELLSMALASAKAAPRKAFEAVNGVTDLVWGISGANEGVEDVSNTGDIEEARYGSAKLNTAGRAIVSVIDAIYAFAPIEYLFKNIGVLQLSLLIITLWAFYRGGTSRLIAALPALCYNLATMLLLCGNDARFFMYFTACAPLTALGLVYLPANDSSEAEDK